MRRIFSGLFLLLTAATGFCAPAEEKGHVTASLIAETMSLQPGKPLLVAVRLQHAGHWHTYWKNPGDSGLATSIEWKLPPGFTAGPILWPAPHRIDLGPLTSYGYEGDVLLLTEITVPAGFVPSGAIPLEAHVRWLECDEICVPGSAMVKLSLPAQLTAPVSDLRVADLFEKALRHLPLPAPADTVQVFSTGPDWRIEFIVPGAPSAATFFSHSDQDVVFSAPQVLSAVTASPGRYALTFPRGSTPGPGLAGVLALTTGQGSLLWEINQPATSAPVVTAPAPPPSSATLLLAVLSAFAGGIILNLMPCVLPVLSLKILGFVHHAGGSRARSFQHGLAFTGGVLVSFWSLAGLLLALRAGGSELGWGFQLQEPLFVVLLGSFLFLFGLNLLGVFEIGTSLIGLAGQSGRGEGIASSFLSGVLATVVATPCTAPFMGSALGLALGLPPVYALLIFTALALGMAAPYLLLSAFPALLRFVPKPGEWMVSLKQFFGFLLLATVIWLVWVFGQQADMNAVALLLFGFLLLGLAAWIYGRWVTPLHSEGTRFTAMTVGAVLLGLGLWLPLAHSAPSTTVWEPYSATRLAELRGQGKPVFLDFTAAWCLSCQVNERVALHNDAVQKKLTEKGVVLMKADWTRSDPVITAALAAFGRNSVPLYVLYPPDPQAPPKLLPEVLTPSLVLEALETLP